jgi:heme/copper-type cytochrome/quinol oxidase subunit 2
MCSRVPQDTWFLATNKKGNSRKPYDFLSQAGLSQQFADLSGHTSSGIGSLVWLIILLTLAWFVWKYLVRGNDYDGYLDDYCYSSGGGTSILWIVIIIVILWLIFSKSRSS